MNNINVISDEPFSFLKQVNNFEKRYEEENMAANRERKINVLGTEYKYFYKSVNQDEKLRECGGYCDSSVKHIVVCDLAVDNMTVGDVMAHENKVFLHEVVHSFLFESGLSGNSWAANEEIVDWMAHQIPKIVQSLEEAGLDGCLKRVKGYGKQHQEMEKEA